MGQHAKCLSRSETGCFRKSEHFDQGIGARRRLQSGRRFSGRYKKGPDIQPGWHACRQQSNYRKSVTPVRLWHGHRLVPLPGGPDRKSGFVGKLLQRLGRNTLGRTYGTRSGQNYTFIRFSAYHQSTPSDFPNYNDKYALFRFDVGGQTDYGWLELSVGGGQYPVRERSWLRLPDQRQAHQSRGRA